MEAPRPSILGGYRPGLRSDLGASATAYGYTLTAGPTTILHSHAYGPPEPLEVFLFCGGAILAFALVGALAFGGVTEHFEDYPKRIQLWGSFRFLSGGVGGGRCCFNRGLLTGRPWLAAGSVCGNGHVLANPRIGERCGRPGTK